MTWTPLLYVWPRRYIDNSHTVRRLNFDRWSKGFEWEQDGWNGLKDVAERPQVTISMQSGDCEDYALVAASWAYARQRHPVKLAFCFPEGSPIPRHVVAADKYRVYSSGEIYEDTSVEEYVEQSKYGWCLERKI